MELSFARMWDHSLEGKFVPLNIDKRFLLKFCVSVAFFITDSCRIKICGWSISDS